MFIDGFYNHLSFALCYKVRELGQRACKNSFRLPTGKPFVQAAVNEQMLSSVPLCHHVRSQACRSAELS